MEQKPCQANFMKNQQNKIIYTANIISRIKIPYDYFLLLVYIKCIPTTVTIQIDR